MAEGFRFMLLGLGWEPFGSVHGLLRCNINSGVHARACGADVSLRDVTIAQIGNRDGECEWRHAPEARGGFLVELKTRHFRVSQRPDEFARYGRRTRWWWWWWGKWKSQNRKNLYLSPYVEEPLNSKVIKSFVPELRSRKCFSSFEISMFYVYVLWTFYVRFT